MLSVNFLDFFFSCYLAWQAGQRPPHAEPQEMNKPPQPITGPQSVPHPAPSPGLTQVRTGRLKFGLCLPHVVSFRHWQKGCMFLVAKT